MNTTWFFDELKKQGFSIVLMGFALWFVISENKDIRSEIKDCNAEIVEIYRRDHILMREIILNNTEAVQELRSIIIER